MAENSDNTATADADLDDLMRSTAEIRPALFSNATKTLRFYLQERKRMIGEGREFDLVTAQGIWYLVEPYIPKKADGEFVSRDNFVTSIRTICKNDLKCRREDLKIVAGQRADLYFGGEWTSISWDNIEALSDSGTDGILIEKDGMSRIFVDFVDPYGFAVINTRGFFVDYLNDVSTQSIDKKCNLVLITDFDPSGLLMRITAKQLGIPCIGVDDEMLQYLKLTRKDVQDKHPPSAKNTHWIKIKNIAKTDPEINKELTFLSKYRIEIDKVHVKVGSKKLFEYVKNRLKEYHRDLNRVVFPEEYVQPDALGWLAYEMQRIGKDAAEPEFYTIYKEQSDFKGLCKDIYERQKQNDERIKFEVESNEDIKWAIKEIEPVVKRLQKVKTG